MRKRIRRLDSTYIWMSITLGGYKSFKEMGKAIKSKGMYCTESATVAMAHESFTIATEKVSVNLVTVWWPELGLERGASLNEIYQRARELGLKPCPPEVGSQLRIQYQNQSEGGWLIVITEPYTVPYDKTRHYVHLFSVECNEGVQGLDGYHHCLESGDSIASRWYEGRGFVFVLDES